VFQNSTVQLKEHMHLEQYAYPVVMTLG